ncbi:MAG: NAD(P)/FAD-dependent oxidoreductase [Acidobacteriia bacterium]|nr:NAD(P)/FAD-dependent oxidoreductase [Terriglobia bacterium]
MDQSPAVVIGSGPNGLAAAILLARAGRKVTVYEAADRIGGGTCSAELTLPGFVHDVCSAIHPMAVASPCFEQFPLAEHGLEWIHPDAPVAHPLDDGTAVMLERSLDATCANLGPDGEAWRRLLEPFVMAWPKLRGEALAPLLRTPRHPFLMGRLGLYGLRSAHGLADSLFRGPRARALFAGLAAHSVLPLESRPSAVFGVIFALTGRTVGWPLPRGGSQHIADALAAYLRSLGGEIRTESPITRLPDAPLILGDVTPRQLLAVAGDCFPEGYRKALARWRYGPGAFKMDWALDGPIPWRAPECARAATVHLGGTLEEIARWEAGHTGPPFVLLAQQSLFDPSRAPAGKHTGWAYCHVPNGSTADMSGAIEDQVERFAPGFRKRILARSILPPAALERRNPNLVGGDFAGGVCDLRQTALRPTPSLYATPLKALYLCSASTPPGPGVHGMCGYYAVRAAGVPVQPPAERR